VHRDHAVVDQSHAIQVLRNSNNKTWRYAQGAQVTLSTAASYSKGATPVRAAMAQVRRSACSIQRENQPD
jgi:hypothetical protein